MSFAPHPQDLKYFIELAKRGNMTRAAEALAIQQPTLSLALKRLEDGYGLKLVNRDKRGITLTEEGVRLESFAQELLALFERAELGIALQDNKLSGTLKIGCHPSVARYSLTEPIKSLLKQNPELKVELIHDISRKVQTLLLERRVDCGLVMNPLPHPDLILIPIMEDFMGIFTSENNVNEDVLIYDLHLSQCHETLKQTKAGRFKRHIECSNLEVIARMVHEGCGYGILPQRVAALLTQPKLKLDANSPKIKDKLFLCFLAQNKKNRAIRELKILLQKS